MRGRPPRPLPGSCTGGGGGRRRNCTSRCEPRWQPTPGRRRSGCPRGRVRRGSATRRTPTADGGREKKRRPAEAVEGRLAEPQRLEAQPQRPEVQPQRPEAQGRRLAEEWRRARGRRRRASRRGAEGEGCSLSWRSRWRGCRPPRSARLGKLTTLPIEPRRCRRARPRRAAPPARRATLPGQPRAAARVWHRPRGLPVKSPARPPLQRWRRRGQGPSPSRRARTEACESRRRVRQGLHGASSPEQEDESVSDPCLPQALSQKWLRWR